jgi:hypothetical protein
MPMDYPVFEPNDKQLAEIIVRILKKRGYYADYQRSYPNHIVFIKVETQEEADKISKIIKNFMEKFRRIESGIATYKLDTSITKLSSLIPETSKRKREKLVEKIKKEIENEDNNIL